MRTCRRAKRRQRKERMFVRFVLSDNLLFVLWFALVN